jgi:hypothetical protein
VKALTTIPTTTNLNCPLILAWQLQIPSRAWFEPPWRADCTSRVYTNLSGSAEEPPTVELVETHRNQSFSLSCNGEPILGQSRHKAAEVVANRQTWHLQGALGGCNVETVLERWLCQEIGEKWGDVFVSLSGGLVESSGRGCAAASYSDAARWLAVYIPTVRQICGCSWIRATIKHFTLSHTQSLMKSLHKRTDSLWCAHPPPSSLLPLAWVVAGIGQVPTVAGFEHQLCNNQPGHRHDMGG